MNLSATRTIRHFIISFLTGIIILSGCIKKSENTSVIFDLRCENLSEPLGVGTSYPRLSWKIQSEKNGTSQTAWQILVASDSMLLTEENADLWNSGKVKSEESILIGYKGIGLKAGTYACWKIRMWDENRAVSAWSKTSFFSIGLLDSADWKAGYIGLSDPAATEDLTGSPMLRQKFTLKDNRQKLLIHVNSLGYHEVYVNGKKVSENVLTPAVSQFNKRSQVITYDVSGYAKPGENDLILWLGRGWYSFGLPGVVNKGPLVRSQLEMVSRGKREILVATDSTWKGRMSEYSATGSWKPHRFGGEIADGSGIITDWSAESLDKLEWNPVTTVNVPAHKATPQMAEPNRIQETIPADTVIPIAPQTWLVDMGKSLTGWLKVDFPPLKKGQQVLMEYCDHLNDGKFVDRNQKDMYIASGSGNEHFINKFNYHGFRYVKISNLPVKPAKESVTGYLIHTNYRMDSGFECSDEDMNRIHTMIRYTFRCLSLGGYLVDCPQLERLGYGGDGNASTESAQTMFGLAPLYANWLQAWGDCIRDEGSMPHTAPNPYNAGGGPYWCGFIITATWRTYLNYGDITLLEKYYPVMQQWLGYVEKYSPNGLLKKWPNTDYRNWYLGDWAAPKDVDIKSETPVDLVNNSFIVMCYDYMRKIATVLGKKDDVNNYETKCDALKKLVHQTYFNREKNSYGFGTQIELAFPLLAGVVPEELKTAVRESLFAETERRGGHIACGLVGVPVLTEWAVENKAPGFIYSILKRKDYPGYLYMIENGATTTWEEWEHPRSYIHNCFNGIGAWFYQAVGGIRFDKDIPAGKHIIIDPQIPKGITRARTSRETPYGPVRVNWEKKGKSFTATIEVPVGTKARVIFPPDITKYSINGAEKRIKSSKNFTGIQSGKYLIAY